jgi:galactose mutarotase-like enzyme
MRYAIENERLSAAADTLGAELAWIYDKSEDRDILWRGSPAGWTGRAPLLFPVVGGLKDGGFTYRGKRYTLAKHGFACESEFALAEKDARTLRFSLRDSARTLSQYPFPFALTVTYTLEDNALVNRCEVNNTGTADMLFSLGFHPAFYWGEGDWLEIAGVAQAGAHRLDFDNQFLLIGRKEPAPFEDGRLYNRETLFQKGAWIFDDLPGAEISLVSPRRSLRLTVSHRAPCFGLWGGPGAPFVAVEPWYGIDDLPDTSGDLEKKPMILRLAPGASWSGAITLSVGRL